MIRPLAALRMPVVGVLAAVLPTLALSAPVAPARADPAIVATQPGTETADPLAMTIETMAPTVIPEKGPITLTGNVTNNSADPWRSIKVYPRLSNSPLTTSAEVALAAESDPRLPFGDRITSAGQFDTSISRLEPGETRTWSVQIPNDVLATTIRGTEGTYQIGVQALGASVEGIRPENAIGRARTFIPLMGTDRPRVSTSIVVPVRRPVVREDDGRIAHEAGWDAEFAPDGRLRRLADMVNGSGRQPVTLAIDPAVLTAAAQLAKANPARDLGQPKPEGADEGPEVDDETRATTAPTGPARSWLNDITSLAKDNEVLALPFGDVDVDVASIHDRPLYTQARTLSDETLSDLKIASKPAVVPPSGLLSPEAVGAIEPDTTLLVSSEAIPGETGDEAQPSRLTFDDHTLSVYDPSLTLLPEGETYNAVTVRQRVLAEASVLSLSDAEESLVVNLPTNFDPGPSAGAFFIGLTRPFLKIRGLSTNTAGGTRTVTELDYPRRQQRQELPLETLAAARDLITAGTTLDNILVGADKVARNTTEEALSYASYMSRNDPGAARRHAERSTSYVQTSLKAVTLEAPSFVILSAASGRFAVKVTNGLDVPVAVALSAQTRDALKIRAPREVKLEANTSRTIRLDATATSIGVHAVELVVTDLDGNPLGSSEQVSVRANSVGKVIWVILGVGVGILFLAIPVRSYRRHRKRRSA